MAVYQVIPCNGGNVENWEIPDTLGVPNIGDGIISNMNPYVCYQVVGNGDEEYIKTADNLFKSYDNSNGCEVCINRQQLDNLVEIDDCDSGIPGTFPSPGGYVDQFIRDGNGNEPPGLLDGEFKTSLYPSFPGSWPLPPTSGGTADSVENMVGVFFSQGG